MYTFITDGQYPVGFRYAEGPRCLRCAKRPKRKITAVIVEGEPEETARCSVCGRPLREVAEEVYRS